LIWRFQNRQKSFTDILLRVAKKRSEGTLLDYIRSLKPDGELAETLEQILKERQELEVPTPRL
jgi:predicted CopG family antitoxin